MDKTNKPEVIIRPARPGDAGYIVCLHGKLYQEEYGFGESFEYYVMKALGEFLGDKNGGGLWVAEVSGKIAGGIGIVKGDENFAQLRWFIVGKEFQGMGIGAGLLNEALKFSRSRGYDGIYLWTLSFLEAARSLYKRAGFEPVCQKTNDEWAGQAITEEKWILKL